MCRTACVSCSKATDFVVPCLDRNSDHFPRVLLANQPAKLQSLDRILKKIHISCIAFCKFYIRYIGADRTARIHRLICTFVVYV